MKDKKSKYISTKANLKVWPYDEGIELDIIFACLEMLPGIWHKLGCENSECFSTCAIYNATVLHIPQTW